MVKYQAPKNQCKMQKSCRRKEQQPEPDGKTKPGNWYKFVIYTPWQSPDCVCRSREGNLPISYLAFISSLSSRTAQHRLRYSFMVENLFISTSKERSRSILTTQTQESPHKKNTLIGTEDIIQWLKYTGCTFRGSGSISSTNMVAESQEIQCPLLVFTGNRHTCGTQEYMQAKHPYR